MIFAFQSICAQNIEVPVDVLGKGKMLFENPTENNCVYFWLQRPRGWCDAEKKGGGI